MSLVSDVFPMWDETLSTGYFSFVLFNIWQYYGIENWNSDTWCECLENLGQWCVLPYVSLDHSNTCFCNTPWYVLDDDIPKTFYLIRTNIHWLHTCLPLRYNTAPAHISQLVSSAFTSNLNGRLFWYTLQLTNSWWEANTQYPRRTYAACSICPMKILSICLSSWNCKLQSIPK